MVQGPATPVSSAAVSGSNSSLQSPRTTPGLFSPPPISNCTPAPDIGMNLNIFCINLYLLN